ncbi:LacI family DNA-binding transcriptional regulator [Nibricoccus aquaticus]|nr:LacI family DNA-binding transcriptional regulator [Nibricoccus aquaticus]
MTVRSKGALRRRKTAPEFVQPMSSRRCTIKDIAAHAGVAVSTVSYALRNHPSIPKETCARIQAVGEKLGYRPDPQISALMAHIGRGRAVPSSARIALVWMQGKRAHTRSDDFFLQMREGANERAGLRGYHLEEFWPDEDRLSGPRLTSILKARGIQSVIFSPSIEGVASDYGLGWENLACVVLGHARWPVELHRVAHDHYHGICECLQRMTAAGVTRPAIVLTEEINQRTDSAVKAAFITHHPSEGRARGLIYPLDQKGARAFPAWLRTHNPDGVLLLRREMWADVKTPRLEKLRQAGRVWCANWKAGDPLELPGIQQRYDLAARAAVDLVTGLEQSRTLGLPDHPQCVQIRGDWREHTVA